MRSAARAIAWEFRRRHRWGLIALSAYLLILTTYRLFAPGRITFEDAQSFAFAVIVPMTSTFLYFLGVFSYGLAGDLSARQSMYPAHTFTLPVTTAALAGWPMLYGTVVMAILWMVLRLLAVWPADVEVPVFWPALLAASLLAWTQALTWMPYPLPGLRVIVTVVWLMTIDAIVMLALELKASEPVMVAILAPHVPLAYFTACFAVARARNGDIPDWRELFARLGRIADRLRRRAEHFPSAARAQEWLEWRQHGRSLPGMVAIVVPLELTLLFLFSETPVIIFETLVCVLLTPPFMAIFTAATVSRATPNTGDSYGVAPFIATRPLTSLSLIAAKLKATIRSTLAAWLVVLVAIPVALRLSGTAPVVIDWGRQLVEAIGKPRAFVLVLLALFVFIAATWKQLVQSLYVGLTGREWLIKASVFVTLTLLTILFPVALWAIENKVAMAALWNAIPWILAVLVCFKLSAAAWIVIRLRDHRLLSDRTLVIGAISWDIAVFALYGLLLWLTPSLMFRSYFLALLAILEIPLTRLSAAPLALAWNRHR